MSDYLLGCAVIGAEMSLGLPSLHLDPSLSSTYTPPSASVSYGPESPEQLSQETRPLTPDEQAAVDAYARGKLTGTLTSMVRNTRGTPPAAVPASFGTPTTGPGARGWISKGQGMPPWQIALIATAAAAALGTAVWAIGFRGMPKTLRPAPKKFYRKAHA